MDDANNLYKKIPFATTAGTVSILHNLENVYIQAVIANDNLAIQQSLKGIIRCKKLLNQDTTNFEKEYSRYNFQPPKPQTKPQEVITPMDDNHIIKNNKNISLPRLKKITISKGSINLYFNKNLKYKDVLFFELNFDKKYKDIYDIKAVLPPNINRNIYYKGISRIQLSQNNKEKIRLVLENKNKIPSTAYIKNNQLVIHIKYIKKQKTKEVYAKATQTKDYKTIKKYSKLIVIDPGHGGKDSGAVGYNHLQEKRTVLAIALKLRAELRKRGYRVFMTRSSDRFIDLKDRTHFANKHKVDLFISIHANAIEGDKKYSIKGVETFYLSPARSARAKRAAAKENKASLINMDSISKNTLLNFLNRFKINQSKKLAIDIQSNILRDLRAKYKGIVDGAVRPAPFWVLVGAGMPAVLIETGYITNPTEARRLFNPFYQKTLAKGIADGIESYFYKN